jgi:hypothetical protein
MKKERKINFKRVRNEQQHKNEIKREKYENIIKKVFLLSKVLPRIYPQILKIKYLFHRR